MLNNITAKKYSSTRGLSSSGSKTAAAARHELGKQSLLTQVTEIDELKKTMRYLEVQIAKLNEDKEKLTGLVQSSNQAQEVSVCSDCSTVVCRKLS